MLGWEEWLVFFFLYAGIGWMWESGYVSLVKRRWVNRGFLHMPLLPLYGVCAVMQVGIALLLPDILWVKFVVGALFMSGVEYITGITMENVFHRRYWDYSERPLQYRGYVCLEATLLWGIFGLLLTEWLHPYVIGVLRTFDIFGLVRRIGGFLVALLGIDFYFSVKRARRMQRNLHFENGIFE